MDRPRAADDFDVIRQRLEELRREREAAEAAESAAEQGADDSPDQKAERRRRERAEGSPPAWAPTIFTKSVFAVPPRT